MDSELSFLSRLDEFLKRDRSAQINAAQTFEMQGDLVGTPVRFQKEVRTTGPVCK
jgi:hypothetical protein